MQAHNEGVISTRPPGNDITGIYSRPARKQTIRYFGDISTTGEISAESALIALPKLKKQFCRKSDSNKLLRSQNKRLRDKLTSMSDLVNKLQEKFAICQLQVSLFNAR